MHKSKILPDEIRKVNTRYHRSFHNPKDYGKWQEDLIGGLDDSFESSDPVGVWRILLLTVLIMFVFSALFIRLFHLQIVNGSQNRELADSNRIQIKVIHAPRGVIYDRNGVIIAQNEPGFRLVESSPSGIHAKIISRDEALAMELREGDFNNSGQNQTIKKELEVDSVRSYPIKEKTSHILGYLGEITEAELKDPVFKTYKLGDKIGRGGIEQVYEKVLKGVDGGEIIEVDAQGKKIRTLRKTDPIPGQNIYLSLDVKMQEFAFKLLEEHTKKSSSCCGVIIAQDPQSGQVLSLVSYPSYDPVRLGLGLSAPNSPMLNRAISGVYPPGSTFKIASALAGLDSGKVTSATQFEDKGIMHLGQFSFANWYFSQYGKTEGYVDVVKALQRSNDTYFYQLGQLTGEKILADYAKKLRLGEKLGIDIPGEVKGLIPDDEWKLKNVGTRWYPGDTLHMSIGQGFVLTTPLQISNLISSIATNGKQYPPHLALKITSPEGSIIKSFQYDAVNNYQFKQKDIDLIKKGLSLVPKMGGTAWPFFTFPISTVGKTGTAEFGDPKNHTHAWYTSYAPEDNPKIAVTVLLEAGGEGSTNASPVAKELYRWYFSPDKNNLIKDINAAPEASSTARTLGE